MGVIARTRQSIALQWIDGFSFCVDPILTFKLLSWREEAGADRQYRIDDELESR